MRSTLVAFAAVTVLIFAFQVISHIVIFQITFGFANETFFWRMLSSMLIGLLASAVFAHSQKPKTACD